MLHVGDLVKVRTGFTVKITSPSSRRNWDYSGSLGVVTKIGRWRRRGYVAVAWDPTDSDDHCSWCRMECLVNADAEERIARALA